MKKLPIEIQEEIFGYLGRDDLINVMLIDKHTKSIVVIYKS